MNFLYHFLRNAYCCERGQNREKENHMAVYYVLGFVKWCARFLEKSFWCSCETLDFPLLSFKHDTWFWSHCSMCENVRMCVCRCTKLHPIYFALHVHNGSSLSLTLFFFGRVQLVQNITHHPIFLFSFLISSSSKLHVNMVYIVNSER